eukprot:CAMPEP_0173142862 /NCGR_PEP_ID=MMETSP1105-20130129/6338_1 /TAXON_ID=2985 /ORGANISM="Ochromonas sp., Strain BG-1" /LENGTH=254 /DNA_ID=CAMNT_0014056329 /DNA_START=56 /DNA_END=820 /DNA_ORIENTATION=-
MVFGDLFRQRADYSKGLFYSGRNGIFSQQNTSIKVHPEGPKIIRKSMIISSTKEGTITEPVSSASTNSSVDLKLVIEPQASEIDKENVLNNEVKHKPDESKTFTNILTFKFAKDSIIRQRSPKKRSNTIVIENHWKQELFGGVKTWVNQLTGEVSLEDPHRNHPVSPKGGIKQATKGRSKTVDSSLRQYFPWSGKHDSASKKEFRFGISFSGKFQESNESSKVSCRNPDMKELFALLDGTKGESEKIVTKPLQA